MSHYERAEEILNWLRQGPKVDASARQVYLLEALTHAVMAVTDAITLVPGAMP